MKKVTTLLSTAIAMATMAVGLQSAHAQDEKTYMPAFCRAVSGANGIRFGTHGEIFNASTGDTLTVECPIVRDSVIEAIEEITVTFRDRNATAFQDIDCSVRFRGPTGSFNASGSARSAGATDVGAFNITTLFAGAETFNPGNRASVLLRCRIPGATSASPNDQSAIFHYRVQE